MTGETELAVPAVLTARAAAQTLPPGGVEPVTGDPGTPQSQRRQCSRQDSRGLSGGRNTEREPRIGHSPCPRAPHRSGRRGDRGSSGWSSV